MDNERLDAIRQRVESAEPYAQEACPLCNGSLLHNAADIACLKECLDEIDRLRKAHAEDLEAMEQAMDHLAVLIEVVERRAASEGERILMKLKHEKPEEHP